LHIAALLSLEALSTWPAIRQERPKLFLAAECAALTIANALNQPGQFPAGV
jgi:hypothetical protein